MIDKITNFNEFFEKIRTYDVTLKVAWALALLKSPLINNLKVQASLRVFVSGIFKVSHHP